MFVAVICVMIVRACHPVGMTSLSSNSCSSRRSSGTLRVLTSANGTRVNSACEPAKPPIIWPQGATENVHSSSDDSVSLGAVLLLFVRVPTHCRGIQQLQQAYLSVSD